MKRVRRGLPPYFNKVYSASGRCVAPTVDPAMADLKQKFEAQALELGALKLTLVVKQKKIIIDSGANNAVISDRPHVNSNSSPLCRRDEAASGIETTDGAF